MATDDEKTENTAIDKKKKTTAKKTRVPRKNAGALKKMAPEATSEVLPLPHARSQVTAMKTITLVWPMRSSFDGSYGRRYIFEPYKAMRVGTGVNDVLPEDAQRFASMIKKNTACCGNESTPIKMFECSYV